jgi:hypothetical protein
MKLITLFFSLCLLSGCASITRGTKEVVVIDTSPQDAEVRLSTGQVGRTPASFEVPRRDTITVMISKPGFNSRTVVLQSEVGGGGAAGMAGNIFFGGIIGAGVDAGTGAMYEHKPNPLMVILEKSEVDKGSAEKSVAQSPDQLEKR